MSLIRNYNYHLRSASLANVSQLDTTALKMLQKLSISPSYIPSNFTFGNNSLLSSLVVTDMENVPFVVENKKFEGLINLKNLVLNNNGISEIRNNGFPHLPSLTSLYLEYNSISVIEKYGLATMANLESLDLQKNLIENIEDLSFQNLTKLKFL
ncbi:Leucine-rich repeat-containing G-protein coupled receptor 6 [Trichoplax sp. H2]|nr:Leucine-rich repeat-containing G-protein coupled receptor 6 [Trichoplax sp. H2]|eukprot:RDD36384.1 Leucine-rich repeat-containing G-protein coupled receptor 6 [Trichoplax sp. H2]